jgi:hypothetical protein
MAAFLISSGRFYGPPLGTIETYAAGTTTPLATYTTQAASVANPTTINIPASGYVQMWGGAGLSYRLIVKDSAGVTVYDQDNVSPRPFDIDGIWNSRPLILNGRYLWVDSTGDLRIHSAAPTSDTSGAVVGAQT